MDLTEVIERNKAAEQAETNRLRQELQDIIDRHLTESLRLDDWSRRQQKVFLNTAEARRSKSYVYDTVDISYLMHSLCLYVAADGRTASAIQMDFGDERFYFVSISDFTLEKLKQILYNIAHPNGYCF